MRTIDQLRTEATASIASSPKRAMTLTGAEFTALVEATTRARNSVIAGVAALHSKLSGAVGVAAATVPIKIPATEILILTTLGD